jgi:hypothetical protein
MNAEDGVVSWAALTEFSYGGGLTAAGRQAVRMLLADLQQMLGPTWPRRQQLAFAGLPLELGMFSFHAAALPQFLNLTLRLRAAVREPTFGPLRSALSRGLNSTDWRHLLLQLEVARLGAAVGRHSRFEPTIPGTGRSADVILDDPTSQDFLTIETTSLFRSVRDRQHSAYEERLNWSLVEIEQQHGVFLQTHLTAHLDADGTASWLREVSGAAAQTRRTGVANSVSSPAGTVIIQAQPAPEGTTTFFGVLAQEDSWRRLARAIHGKVRQISGSISAWIRVDALDGFFQFTDWSRYSWPERVDALADALRETFADVSHVAGVVVSSGLAISPGALNSTDEDVTAVTAAGTGVRRCVAPHLVRETFVIPLRAAVDRQVEVWSAGYASEPGWLDNDLQVAGLPPLSTMWQ